MAIDEKKLIEEIENIQVVIVGMRTGKSEFSEYIKRFKNHIIQIINNQPKISLENKTSDWIPVEEALPVPFGNVFVCDEDGFNSVGVYLDDEDGTPTKWITHADEDYNVGKIVAWMYIPQYKMDK